MWGLLFSKDKSLMFSATDQTGNSNSGKQWVYFTVWMHREGEGKRKGKKYKKLFCFFFKKKKESALNDQIFQIAG